MTCNRQAATANDHACEGNMDNACEGDMKEVPS
jgi:hypothetical protein